MKCFQMRGLFVFSMALILSAALCHAEGAKEKPKPYECLQALKVGNARFVLNKSEHPHTDSARLIQAGRENQGNHAFATVITCSDSRVPVERIFDAGIMDLFVIRVAGNVLDTDEIGSVEYGIAHVNTPIFVILGHTQCGAVTAVTHEVQGHGHKLEYNIPALVDNIVPAVKTAMHTHPEITGDDIIPLAIEENVYRGAEDLFTKSATAREMVKSGKLMVVGAIYDVGTGKILWLPESEIEAALYRAEASPELVKQAMAGDDSDKHVASAGHASH